MRCRSLWSVAMVGMLCSGLAQAAGHQPAMARGWIVKLKESKPQPVVRLAAAAVPSDGPTSQRNRLWQAAQRQRVSIVAHRPAAFGAQVIRAASTMTLAQAEAEADRLRGDPDVEWVVVNAVERRAATTNVLPVTDPAYGSQTWLAPRVSGLAGVGNFPAAWQAVAVPRATSQVAVAVLDTGILSEPDELDGRILQGYDFISESVYARDGNGRDADPSDAGDWMDDATRQSNPLLYDDKCENEDSSWHGTAIAAMLVASVNNGQYGTGMLAAFPDVKVLPVRVGGVCGADRADILDAMLWAAGIPFSGSPPVNQNPAKVISLSFGGSDACSVNTGYPRVIEQLRNAGVLLVASAGNGDDSGRGLSTPTVPANCQGVMAVTALNQRGSKATYANLVRTGDGLWGIGVAGGDVNTSGFATDDGVQTLLDTGSREPSGTFVMSPIAGTSFATPQVAGVAAMLWSLDSSLSLNQVMSILVNSARPWAQVNAELSSLFLPLCSSSQRGACRCADSTCGSGVLDAAAAVGAVLDETSPFRQELSNDPDPVASESGGGGGGGHIGWPWGLALYALLLGGWWSQRRRTQNLQAVKV